MVTSPPPCLQYVYEEQKHTHKKMLSLILTDLLEKFYLRLNALFSSLHSIGVASFLPFTLQDGLLTHAKMYKLQALSDDQEAELIRNVLTTPMGKEADSFFLD